MELLDGVVAKVDTKGMLCRDRRIAAGMNESQREVQDPIRPVVLCRRCKGGNIMSAEMKDTSLPLLFG
jgi:hypothetical protein